MSLLDAQTEQSNNSAVALNRTSRSEYCNIKEQLLKTDCIRLGLPHSSGTSPSCIQITVWWLTKRLLPLPFLLLKCAKQERAGDPGGEEGRTMLGPSLLGSLLLIFWQISADRKNAGRCGCAQVSLSPCPLICGLLSICFMLLHMQQ